VLKFTQHCKRRCYLLHSLTERVRFVAVTPENISEIAAAVVTDAKPTMYTSAKRPSHRGHYHILWGSRSLRYCYFTRISAVKHLFRFLGARDETIADTRCWYDSLMMKHFFRSLRMTILKRAESQVKELFRYMRPRWVSRAQRYQDWASFLLWKNYNETR